MSFHWFHWISDSENLNFVFVGNFFFQISSMGKLFSSSCFMKTFPFNISFQLFLFDADSSKEQKFTTSVNQVTAYGLTPAPSQVLGTVKEPGKLVTRLLIETLHTNETAGITLWAANVYEGKNTFGFQSLFAPASFNQGCLRWREWKTLWVIASESTKSEGYCLELYPINNDA